MKRVHALVLLTVGLGIGLGFGFVLGLKHASFQLALQENRVAAANLKFAGQNGDSELAPQLREYLKARIYSNVHTYYPSTTGYLLERDWNFGPVNRTNLGNIAVFKDPNQIAWDWSRAIEGK
jgi:hypothetical protein